MNRIRRPWVLGVVCTALTLASLLLAYSTFFAGSSSAPVGPILGATEPAPSRNDATQGIRSEVGEGELADQHPIVDSVPRVESGGRVSPESNPWHEKVRGLARAEQAEVLAELEKQYEDLIRPECERRLREGQYLVVGYGAEWKDYYWDETEVMKLYFFGEGKPIRKVILPRGGFPEAYELHDRIAWCRKLLGRE